MQPYVILFCLYLNASNCCRHITTKNKNKKTKKQIKKIRKHYCQNNVVIDVPSVKVFQSRIIAPMFDFLEHTSAAPSCDSPLDIVIVAHPYFKHKLYSIAHIFNNGTIDEDPDISNDS